MKWEHTKKSKADFNSAPEDVKRAFEKQARLLAENLRHPSLHAKKYSESIGLWQARVNADWRFYFLIISGTYFITNIKRHPK